MVRPVFSQRVRFNLITHDNLPPLRNNSEMKDDNVKKDEYDEDNDEDSLRCGGRDVHAGRLILIGLTTPIILAWAYLQ